MQSSRLDSLWRNRWLPWLLLTTMFVLTGAALAIFVDYQRTVEALVIQTEHQLTRLSAVRVRDELSGFPNALFALARSSDIVSQDPARQATALQKAAPIREGLFDAGIVVLNNFGTVTAVQPPRPDLLQQDWSDRNYYRGLLNSAPSSIVFSDAVSDGPEGSPVVVVSVPVIDGEGRFVGVLAGMLRLSQSTISPYYATLVKLRVSPQGTAYVVDRSSKILFDSASLEEGKEYNNHRLPPSGDANAAEALRTRDDTGREILVSHAPIPGTPWTLVIEKEWGNLVAPAKTQVNLLLVMLGLAATLPLLSMVFFARQRETGYAWDDAIGRESRLARQIEDALLPQDPPMLAGWEIAVHHEIGSVPGGAFYDLLLGVDGCLTLMIAEKGSTVYAGEDEAVSMRVPTVLGMVKVRTLLRSAARDLLSPAKALERTNRALCPEQPAGNVIHSLYCRLDPANGAITLGNADLAQPIRVGESRIEPVSGTDPALALQLDTQYSDYGSRLAGCEYMLFYSKAIVEARNTAGEEFGIARLEHVLSTAGEDRGRRIAAVTGALRVFAGKDWAQDRDAILIVLERLPGRSAQSELQEA